MRVLGRGLLLGLLGLLATSAPARAETSAELTERLHKATAVLSELASGKQDTDIPREVLARARAIAVEGATVQPDGSAIRALYGAKADSRDVLLGTRYTVPTAGRPFVNVLTTYSPPSKKR